MKFDYDSRFPSIIAALDARVDEITKDAAKVIETRAKARVVVQSGALRNAIHTEQVSPGVQSVTAGNEDVFYGHAVEHGSVGQPARPFLVPALEESVGEVSKGAKNKLGDL